MSVDGPQLYEIREIREKVLDILEINNTINLEKLSTLLNSAYAANDFYAQIVYEYLVKLGFKDSKVLSKFQKQISSISARPTISKRLDLTTEQIAQFYNIVTFYNQYETKLNSHNETTLKYRSLEEEARMRKAYSSTINKVRKLLIAYEFAGSDKEFANSDEYEEYMDEYTYELVIEMFGSRKGLEDSFRLVLPYVSDDITLAQANINLIIARFNRYKSNNEELLTDLRIQYNMTSSNLMVLEKSAECLTLLEENSKEAVILAYLRSYYIDRYRSDGVYIQLTGAKDYCEAFEVLLENAAKFCGDDEVENAKLNVLKAKVLGIVDQASGQDLPFKEMKKMLSEIIMYYAEKQIPFGENKHIIESIILELFPDYVNKLHVKLFNENYKYNNGKRKKLVANNE